MRIIGLGSSRLQAVGCPARHVPVRNASTAESGAPSLAGLLVVALRVPPGAVKAAAATLVVQHNRAQLAIVVPATRTPARQQDYLAAEDDDAQTALQPARRTMHDQSHVHVRDGRGPVALTRPWISQHHPNQRSSATASVSHTSGAARP